MDSSRGDDDESDNGESSIGVKTIRTGQAVVAAKKKTATMEPAIDDDEEEPLLMDPSITDLGSALDAADIWLYVLDARDPLAHRSAYLESLANEKSKKIVFLLNKIGSSVVLCSTLRNLSALGKTWHQGSLSSPGWPILGGIPPHFHSASLLRSFHLLTTMPRASRN